MLFCAVLGLWSLTYRIRVEAKNTTVGVAADSDIVRALAAAEGESLGVAFKRLKDAGLTHVVMSEDTVGSLIADGRVTILPSGAFSASPSDGARIRRGIAARFGDQAVTVLPPPDLLRTVAVGLDPIVVAGAKTAGLGIVGRYSNPTGATAQTVREVVAWAAEQGVSVLLPQGDQVLGRRESLDVLAESLKANNILYATPEFAKIGGDINVVQANPEIIVRLHSAQTQELDRMSDASAVERFVKAARERNQRLLLLRPMTLASASPLTSFIGFLDKTKQALAKHGLTLGTPRPFEDSGVPAWVFLLLSLGVAPVAYWVGASLVGDPRLRLLGALLLIGLVAAGTRPSGRPMIALLAAIIFPIAAFLIVERLRSKNWVASFLIASAVSLTGGLVLAGLLNGLPFFVKADEFSGVKIAHFLPVAAIGAIFFVRFGGGLKSLNSPVRWGEAMAAIVSLAILAILISRTGNDNPAAVSGLEVRFRSLLDELLFVRPRSKEFMLGHPALVLGLGMFAAACSGKQFFAKRPVLIVSAITVGSLGMTSVVNTMAHLHTPVTLSLARIGTGWVLGAIIGAVLWAFVERRASRLEGM